MEGDHVSVETVTVKVEPVWGDETEALGSAVYAEHDIKLEQVAIAEIPQGPVPLATVQANYPIKYEPEDIVDPLQTSKAWTTVYEHEIKLEPVISETPQSPTQATVNCEIKQETAIPVGFKNPVNTDVSTVPQTTVFVEQGMKQEPVVNAEVHQSVKYLNKDAPSTSSRVSPALAPKRKGSKSRKLHSCHICQKQFTHLSNVQKHQVIHTGEKPYSCNICNKNFTQLINLKTHKAIHTGIKPYTCKTCEREFTQLANLRSHELTHTGIKAHSCDVCEKKFTRSDSLKTHKFIHTGQKPFSCEVCAKEFIKSSDLRIHKRTHTGQQPYGCDVCQLRFTQKGNLTRHKATHVSNSDTEPTEICKGRPYACDECELRFTQKGNLTRHKATHARNLAKTEQREVMIV